MNKRRATIALLPLLTLSALTLAVLWLYYRAGAGLNQLVPLGLVLMAGGALPIIGQARRQPTKQAKRQRPSVPYAQHQKVEIWPNDGSFCPRCGLKTRAGDKICRRCGGALEEKP